jgi:hypothetical protein
MSEKHYDLLQNSKFEVKTAILSSDLFEHIDGVRSQKLKKAE